MKIELTTGAIFRDTSMDCDMVSVFYSLAVGVLTIEGVAYYWLDGKKLSKLEDVSCVLAELSHPTTEKEITISAVGTLNPTNQQLAEYASDLIEDYHDVMQAAFEESGE